MSAAVAEVVHQATKTFPTEIEKKPKEKKKYERGFGCRLIRKAATTSILDGVWRNGKPDSRFRVLYDSMESGGKYQYSEVEIPDLFGHSISS